MPRGSTINIHSADELANISNGKDGIDYNNFVGPILNIKFKNIEKRLANIGSGCFSDFMGNDKPKKIDWKLTFKTLHPNELTSGYTDSVETFKRSFTIKLLNEELSTMTRRH
ncbi:hypothetical protein Glove_29g142 [Diversispora epigaea]|uniref:Uncharacterized protein n=1 Tax=Diversispora epigaea TaxID=1348612 RepID=A0A397JPF7_9GLOM|nr:hypothetical protein Glove_29g142 [Diversispora epigaea]